MIKVTVSFILFFFSFAAWAGGSQEESGDRGKYVAGQERIISADEIHIDSYISQIDYRYPDPEGDLGVSLYAGHRQVSLHGQEEIIQIGIQGKRERFEDLPPMNLAFVFDKSGSMSDRDKIEWVKKAFEIFLQRLRGTDTVSIVAFAEKADVLLPASRVDTIGSRKALIDRVYAVKPLGKSDLGAGLLAGYEHVKSRFVPGAVNRVIFISDGLGGEPEGILELADRYKKEGIKVSTIGVGGDFNFELMSRLSRRSGGSSRFMSNPEKINAIFNTDLDRMVVPVAIDLNMEIEFLQDVKIHSTWGYEHVIEGRKIRYHLPTLHHRDYETILIWLTTPTGQSAGTRPFARFRLTYLDRAGRQLTSGPHSIKLTYSDRAGGGSGFSNPMVLKAGTMLHIAQALKDIGALYFSSQEDNNTLYTMYSPIWQNQGVEESTHYDGLAQREREEMQKSIQARRQRCLDLAVKLKNEIRNAHLRLEEDLFKDELPIFEMYIKKISRELGLANGIIAKLLESSEIVPPGTDVSMKNQLAHLADELMLELESKTGSVVFGGFAQQGDQSPAPPTALGRLMDNEVESALKKIPALSLLPSWKLTSYLKEQDLGLCDLTDTGVALKTAAGLKADYIITGSLIEMPSSVILFARVLNGKTKALVSVAQLILPLNDLLRNLLQPAL